MADNNESTALDIIEELNRVKSLPNKYGTDSQIDAEFRFNFDVSIIKQELEKLSDYELNSESILNGRKKHSDEAVRIVVYRLFEEMSDYEKFSLQETKNTIIAEEVLEIAKNLESFCSGKMANSLLTIIPAKKYTQKISQSGPLHEATRRFYIFLDSNGTTKVENSTINHRLGDCYEVNNLKSIYSYNNSEEKSSILRIDVVPSLNIEYFLSDPRLASSKTHQNSEFFKGIVRDY